MQTACSPWNAELMVIVRNIFHLNYLIVFNWTQTYLYHILKLSVVPQKYGELLLSYYNCYI